MDFNTKQTISAVIFACFSTFVLGVRLGAKWCKADIERERRRKEDATWVDFL